MPPDAPNLMPKMVRRVDRVDAERPAGQVGVDELDRPELEVHVDEVLEDDRDDLAEAEGHDREVVAAQAQRRRAEQRAEDGRHAGGQPDDDPERDVDPRDGPGAAVAKWKLMPSAPQCGEARNAAVYAPERVERDVAEVQQPGEADDDVQPQRQRGEDEHEDHDRVVGEGSGKTFRENPAQRRTGRSAGR